MANIKARLSPRKNIVVKNFSLGNVDTAVTTGALITETTLPDQVLDTFPKDKFRVVKYTIQVTRGVEVHVLEILLTHDDTETYGTQYGEIFTVQELATLNSDIDVATDNVRLLITPLFENLTIKFTRIEVEV